MKLFIYDHCPFCVKARMIFGLKHLPIRLVTLLNDDETTPFNLIGKKMVPILIKDDGEAMPESLDIVRYVDGLDGKPVLTGRTNPAIAEWLRRVDSYAAKLLLPRIAHADFEEFATDSARRYFIDKKQASIGDFAEHLANSADLPRPNVRRIVSERQEQPAQLRVSGADPGLAPLHPPGVLTASAGTRDPKTVDGVQGDTLHAQDG